MNNMPTDPILIVDDDPTSCRSIAAALEGAGYRVESTTDSVAALWRTLKRTYALLVADLRMPGLLGIALVAEVRRSNPGMPAVLISSFPDQRSVAEARALGVPLLAKPFNVDTFLNTVRSLLQAGDLRSVAS
jgi:DNA-binding NtrC family response regulator